MKITAQSIYEQGVLRLTEPIFLEEGTQVEVIVITQKSNSVEKTPAEIGAIPLEGISNDGFSGREHDNILYS
ncbi:antitoxin family protein [Calothrix sp. 336/3]|uniref:antitoxin family protein n=1 Tax=Calothrix sp. 336/3 TaxID=1337936 RepID=UPI0004E2E9A1|nr:antitoxin family protein [Calothrix sp. 336/3]AKG20723.1 hypothetical protein IJ00_04830 [Calothrix sp. 336/3]